VNGICLRSRARRMFEVVLILAGAVCAFYWFIP
jgi:hypothetical protein